MKLFHPLLVSIIILLFPAKALPHGSELPDFERRVKFWEDVFTRYSDEQVILHDNEHPYIVVEVMGRRDPSLPRKLESSRSLMRDFVIIGKSARHMSPAHRSMWMAYKSDPQAYQNLLLGRSKLRLQRGLASSFAEAVKRSRTQMPRMEQIFAQHNLPVELTRIVFVESMFNPKALSKVGAAGLWQLMPDAARPYLNVSTNHDERYDLDRATHAAAQILKKNFQILGSWPLAVTAYNHGLGGVRRGVKKTGTQKLRNLILKYQSPSFGFASRNFFAEFLAARRSYQTLNAHQK